ncbi:MAG TPA: hypothetical protein VF450_20925 [Noviherbaspirillum sp.]|jgi:hypothetical protein
MPMDQSQGRIWKQITDVYQQWDRDRNIPMQTSDLYERLPAVPPGTIEEILAAAQADGRLASLDGNDAFLPIPNC